MTAHTSQGLANRLGYGLGRVVLFFLVDENLVLRWVKRGVLAVLGYVFFAHFGHGVMSALMTPLILLSVVLAVVKFGSLTQVGSHLKDDGIPLSSSKNLWDIHGSDSLWHGDNERKKG